jgi:putative transposase
MYQVRRVNIGKTDQLDELAHECGRLYSRTLVSFWRTVRHKGIWLKPKHLMRWYTSEKLHAHTADACVQAFFASLKSWRTRRKSDPSAVPPCKRKWYFRIEYKSSALHHNDGVLTLSNGKGNAPLVLKWPWQTPKTVVIRWTGTQYEAVATYEIVVRGHPQGDRVAGIDLGEIHMAVSHDGEQTHILNGRLLRSKRQYQNKLKAKLSRLIDVKKRDSRRSKRLARSNRKQLKKIKSQIKDIEHKQTTRFISTLHLQGVQTVVIGDVREIRQDNGTGSTNNQRIHQWSFGSVRHKLTYKAEQLGMKVVLEDEYHTSRTCPRCGHVRKSKPPGRQFRCTNRQCRWSWHRDCVGAYNIRQKYRGEFGGPHVVAVMAPATGMRFAPHTRVAREQSRETVCMGNCAGAAGP